MSAAPATPIAPYHGSAVPTGKPFRARTGLDKKPVTIPYGRSIIVVSDHHFGLKTNRSQVGQFFADFLTYVHSLRPKGEPGGKTVAADGKEKELYAPAKLILLGDFVDFESPRNNTRASVLADLAPVIPALAALDAEIVFVTGNHDDEISDWEGTYPGTGEASTSHLPSGPGIEGYLHQALHRNLTIRRRHYPDHRIIEEKDGKKRETLQGIRIGEKKYYFMHGQQFDLLFNLAGILQDYPSWVGKNYQLFREKPKLVWFFRGILVLTAFYAVAAFFQKLADPPLIWLAHILFGVSLVIFLFSIQPTTLRDIWDGTGVKQHARNDTIGNIIAKGLWLPEEGDRIDADVIVFGHTHVVDDSKQKYEKDYHKRFINSGDWDRVMGDGSIDEERGETAGSENETNTFVYIDDDGALLFYWPVLEWKPKGERRPVQIVTTPTGDEQKGAEIPSTTTRVLQNFYVKG